MLQISSHHYACMFTQPHKAPVGYGRSVGFKLQHQHVAELRRADICELVLSYGTTYRDDAVVWAKIKHVDSRTSGRLLPAVVDRKFAISQHHPLPLTGGPTSPAQCTCYITQHTVTKHSGAWEDHGSNFTADGCLYHDSRCDIQPWAQATHPYCSAYVDSAFHLPQKHVAQISGTEKLLGIICKQWRYIFKINIYN